MNHMSVKTFDIGTSMSKKSLTKDRPGLMSNGQFYADMKCRKKHIQPCDLVGQASDLCTVWALQ